MCVHYLKESKDSRAGREASNRPLQTHLCPRENLPGARPHTGVWGPCGGTLLLAAPLPTTWESYVCGSAWRVRPASVPPGVKARCPWAPVEQALAPCAWMSWEVAAQPLPSARAQERGRDESPSSSGHGDGARLKPRGLADPTRASLWNHLDGSPAGIEGRCGRPGSFCDLIRHQLSGRSMARPQGVCTHWPPLPAADLEVEWGA